MEIRADGIVLRPWRDDDLEALTAACQDAEIARWLPMVPSPYSEDDGRRYLEQARLNWELGDAYNFAVVDESGRLLGSIAIRILRFSVGHIGYWMTRRGSWSRDRDAGSRDHLPVGRGRAPPWSPGARDRPGQPRVPAGRGEGRVSAGGNHALGSRVSRRIASRLGLLLAVAGRARRRVAGRATPDRARAAAERARPAADASRTSPRGPSSANGFTVYSGSVAGLARNSTNEPAASSLSSPSARPCGDSQICAAARSAANSRFGESSRWVKDAATGARTNRNARWNQPASRVTSIRKPAITDTVVWTSTSRFAMWTSSWARIPSSSAGDAAESSPALTVSDEPRGPRPAANARGCPSARK